MQIAPKKSMYTRIVVFKAIGYSFAQNMPHNKVSPVKVLQKAGTFYEYDLPGPNSNKGNYDEKGN